jgi:hypothetical protein
MIRDLKERGLFPIRGSVKRVSKELNVSLPTIYKYLEEFWWLMLFSAGDCGRSRDEERMIP